MSNNTETKKRIALSFDVEDWFTVRNMRSVVSDADWDNHELRVNIGMDFILHELDKKNIKSTFFILGWIAEKCPELVKKISDQGHEIACHGYKHTPIDLLTPELFEEDLSKAVQILEKITGKKIKGFRAPSFSITEKTAWAIASIHKVGLEYDSSIFVTKHPDYGINNFPNEITKISNIIEVPLKKSSIAGFKIPVCGGGYFRMLPYQFIRAALKNDLKTESVVMYFHPWEFDEDQPRVNIGFLKTFRHYVGLKSNRKKFINLLNDFNFTTIDQLIVSTSQEKKLGTYFFKN
jgi:polysaccharide deacetylase family protein (PEP-CTERM system associated)